MRDRLNDIFWLLLCAVPNLIYLALLIPMWFLSTLLGWKDRCCKRMS